MHVLRDTSIRTFQMSIATRLCYAKRNKHTVPTFPKRKYVVKAANLTIEDASQEETSLWKRFYALIKQYHKKF